MSHPSNPPLSEPAEKQARRRLADWARPVKQAYAAVHALGVMDAVCACGFAAGLAWTLASVWRGHASVWGLLLLVLSPVARAANGYANLRLAQAAARRVIHDLRLGLIDSMLSAGNIGGAQMQGAMTLYETSEALEGYFARFLPARVSAAVVPLLVIAVIAFASPLCALILLFTLLPFVALMALSGMATAAESKRQLDALTRLSVLFSDRIKALPLILAFDNAAAQTEVVAQASRAVSERTLAVLRMAFSGSGVLEFFSALSVALIAVYCGFSLLHLLPFTVPHGLDFRGPSPFATAFFVLALSPEVYAPLRQLSAAYHEGQAADEAARRLIAIEALFDAAPRAIVTLAAAPEVRFDGVTCRFEDDPSFVIGPISFTASLGQIVAITGDSGAGKSTLLRLLLGPAKGVEREGDILIDGRPLDAASDLSPSIAWMSQHTPILGGTLRGNLGLAAPDTDDDAILAVTNLAGLSGLMASRGLDAILNERGSGLSGGERRRIGLARALLKPAPLLVLDEPTADLDAETEEAIIAAIRAAAAGRTVLIATHSDKLMAIASTVVRL